MDILVSKTQLRLNDYSVPNTITLSDIRYMIQQDLYNAYYRTVCKKNSLLEDDKEHGVPKMNEIFYSLFVQNKTISYQVYLDEYKKVNCIKLTKGFMTFKSNEERFHYAFKETALDGKLLRGYMSFLKELYALYSLIDIGYPARYSLEIDNNMGFDIMLYNKHKHYYGIRIYSDTERAKAFANTEKKIRHDYENSPCTSIVLMSKTKKQILGDTYIFTQEQIDAVHNHIRNNCYQNIIL